MGLLDHARSTERTRLRLGRRALRLLAATVVAGGVLWAPARADAIASITCPQALLSFQWGTEVGTGTPHPITMSLGQCTTGFRSSALSYGSGTIATTVGTGAFQGNSEFHHYHVDLTITVPDAVLGPVSVSGSFDVEAALVTAMNPLHTVPDTVLYYAVSGPIFEGLVPAGWWTERSTFSAPNGSSLVEASLAL